MSFPIDAVGLTTNYGLEKPYIGQKPWYQYIYNNLDKIDTELKVNADAIALVSDDVSDFEDLLNNHHARHEFSGADEIDLTNLSGDIIKTDLLTEKTLDSGVTIEDVILKDNRIENLLLPLASSEPATKGYVDSAVDNTFWQPPVISKILTAPPGGEGVGDRYIVASVATGAWAGHEDDIAEVDSISPTVWGFATPLEGWTLRVTSEDVDYTFNGTAWIGRGSSLKHNDTQELNSGDYWHLTASEKTNFDELDGGGETTLHIHDGRYYTETEIDTLIDLYYTKVELDGGQLDNRYYTETELDTRFGLYYSKLELDGGQLDNRYYTEIELEEVYNWSQSVTLDADGVMHIPDDISIYFGDTDDASINYYSDWDELHFNGENVFLQDSVAQNRILGIYSGAILNIIGNGGLNIFSDTHPSQADTLQMFMGNSYLYLDTEKVVFNYLNIDMDFIIKKDNGDEAYVYDNGDDLHTFNSPLEIVGTSSYLKIPSMTTVQRNALTPSDGMVVYDTDLNLYQMRENGAWIGVSGDVVGPAGATNNAIALFDGATGKKIKDSAKTIVTALGTVDTTVPTSKAVDDLLDRASAISEGISTSVIVGWTEKLNISAFTPKLDGDFVIHWSCEMTVNSKSHMQLRIRQDDTTELGYNLEEIVITNDYKTISGFAVVSLTNAGGPYRFDIDFSSPDIDTVSIRRTRMVISRI